jgi:hypothetical protein
LASRVVTFLASRVVTSSFLSLALRRCSFRRGLSPSDGGVRFDGACPRYLSDAFVNGVL